jgi:hypothetical protein
MTTSGTYDLALTTNKAISKAFSMMGQGVDGETLSGAAYDRGVETGNLMLKAWQGQGIHLWSYKEGTLFLKIGQAVYDFRLSSTHAANTWYDTTTTAATVASALTFAVTSADDIQTDDIIGIIQSDNDLFWTTVLKVNGLDVTVRDQITLATLSGARVYNYRPATTTTTTLIPISRVSDVRRQEGTDYEIPIIFESRKEYMNLPNKSANGTPIQAYYARQDVAGETGGKMYLWNAPSSGVPVINFTYERKLQILGASTDTLDMPDTAQLAFIANLADWLVLEYGGVSVEKALMIEKKAASTLGDFLSYDNANYPITLELNEE